MDPAGSIRETVDRALADLQRVLGPGPTSDLTGALRAEFAEPLRVAVGGRIKAGKSTLVNALLRQRVAPTDVGECTRFVTWYRYGLPERLEVVLTTGERVRRPLRNDGSLPPEIDIPGDTVHHLDVFLSNDQLRRVTVIDTPGLASAVEGRSEATRELLALDRDSRAAVSQADVLLLVMALDARADDDEVLGSFEAQFDGLRRTALNAAAVLSRIDLLDTPSAEVRVRAGAVADTIARRLRTPVSAVVPVATLLAETIECGLLSEEDVAALAELARLGETERAGLLRTTDRFISIDAGVPPARRGRLLERLDLHGVTVALNHLATHGPGTAALLRRLREEAGIDDFRERVLDAVARHGDVLKCARLLATLARAGDDGAVRHAVLGVLEQLWLDPSLHAVRLQRAAQLHSAGEASLPADLAQELHALARGATGAVPAAGAAALARAASRWRTYANSGRAGAAEREVADTVCRAYELQYERLRDLTDSTDSTGSSG